MKYEDLPAAYRELDEITKEDRFTRIQDAPIALYGGCPGEKDTFCRLPQALLPECNERIRHLAWHTAGLCARFSTNSSHLAVLWKLRFAPGGKELIACAKSNITACGQSGLELFEETESGSRQIKNFMPTANDGSISLWQARTTPLPCGMRHYALYLPLYNGIEEIYLGLDEQAELQEGRPPKIEKPIVYYGSSITQGGCASKAGSCYTTLLARRLDAAQINLGFCGSACGEEYIARYIAGLEMSVFVLDYDHNAGGELEAIQRRFYQIVREKQPDTPIVMMTMPDFDRDPILFGRRRDALMRNYLKAIEAGDRHVYFADGSCFFGNTDRDLCTIDGVHPTDIGFLRMADYMEPVLRLALAQSGQMR